MTSQGSPHGQFQRALQRGNVLQALALARELAPVPLGEALRLIALIAEREPPRFSRMAQHWHSRFVTETAGISLADASLSLALLQSLGEG